MCYVMIFVLVSYDKKILFFIMILRSLKIICIVVLKSAILIAIFRKMIEKDLYQSFEHNMNLSFCVVCLRNYSTCNTFDFQLDYKRHADYDQYFNYVSMFVLSTIRLINILVSQPNHKIFFGALEFKNGIVVHTVAKVSGYYNSSKLKQMINTSTYIDPTVLENELNLILPNNADDYSLYICSKNDTNSYSLKYNILSSVIDDKNRNNSQLWLEAWVAAHFNAEPVILKILNGYRYAPELYGTCNQVNFVEDCGYTLQYYYHKLNLSNRLLVTKELLKLALELTDGTAHPNYSFYLTDLTADNIAIQLDETSRIIQSLKVIDWSDVIIVINDKYVPIDDNLMVHVSEHIDCGLACLIYSKEEICKASVSDHNVYAVCKEFLSIEGRLLYEITDLDHSQQIQEKEIQELRLLMKHCLLHPDVQWKKSRLDTAKSIIKIIEYIFQQDVYNNIYIYS